MGAATSADDRVAVAGGDLSFAADVGGCVVIVFFLFFSYFLLGDG